MPAPIQRLHIAEPKGSYLKRPPLVADASVMAAALFAEQGHGEAIALLHGRLLHAPHLLDCEIASVGVKKLRRESVPNDIVAAALSAYARLPIERHAVDAQALMTLARRFNLTVYDAAYLCVAEELAAPLATLDERLAGAARVYLTSERQVHDA